jgi:hypothetical protein
VTRMAGRQPHNVVVDEVLFDLPGELECHGTKT